MSHCLKLPFNYQQAILVYYTFMYCTENSFLTMNPKILDIYNTLNVSIWHFYQLDVANAATRKCWLCLWLDRKHEPRKTILCCSFRSLFRTDVPEEDRAVEHSIEAPEEPQKEGRTAEVQKMLQGVRTLTGVAAAGDSPGLTYLGTFLCVYIWSIYVYMQRVYFFIHSLSSCASTWVCAQPQRRLQDWSHSAVHRNGWPTNASSKLFL